MPPPRKADVVRVCGVLENLELVGNNRISHLHFEDGAETHPLYLWERVEFVNERSELTNSGEGKTLSRIAKIRSRSLSNSTLSQGERKGILFPLLGRGCHEVTGEGSISFAQQTEMNLPSYRPNVLSTFKDFAIADRASLVRNDVTTLVPSKRAAFTLAEVLITLGIIGVVAAMTMPVLIQNHRKSVVETRLKHFYSVINQAITLAEVQHGDKTTWQLEDTDDFWNNYLEPHIKYLKVDDDADFQDGAKKSVYLPNGSAFAFNIYHRSSITTNGAHFMFYPDAKRTSDTYGVHAFMFGFWPNGGYYNESTGSYNKNPFKYHQNKGVEPYTANWNGDEQQLYDHSKLGCNNDAVEKLYCTAIIQRNGWKIPDDYPFRF